MARRQWQSWSGLATATPKRMLSPNSAADVAEAVHAARRAGLRVKMIGSGHSFTDIAVTDGMMLRPERLCGVVAADPSAMTVTVLAGTPLRTLNDELEALGLAVHNLGDIDRQTVAGAIATGTHGSGGRWTSLSAQVAAVELVTGDGTIVTADPEHDPALFQAARVGLGAVGILTAVTLRVQPAFTVEATEGPATFDELVRCFDQLVAEHDHVDVHWFPYTEWALVKRNDRTVDPPAPLPRIRRYVDDELLANQLFGLTNRLGNRWPGTVPLINRLAARTLSPRTYRDVSHRVFVAERKVRFREMEYAVPAAAGMQALVDSRRVIDRGRWSISIPVEIRFARAEDPWLATAYGRDTVYLSFHVNAQTDHTDFFRAVEAVMRDHDGRPHWGKLHTCIADDFAAMYSRWADFQAVRDRIDPDRLFGNDYLDRILHGRVRHGLH